MLRCPVREGVCEVVQSDVGVEEGLDEVFKFLQSACSHQLGRQPPRWTTANTHFRDPHANGEVWLPQRRTRRPATRRRRVIAQMDEDKGTEFRGELPLDQRL